MLFASHHGVVHTEVGYALGTAPSPSHSSPSDHVQCVLVEYNPSLVSPSCLLALWSSNHSAVKPAPAPHFRSAAICTTEAQYEALQAMLGGFEGHVSVGGGVGGGLECPTTKVLRERQEAAERRLEFSTFVAGFEGPFYRAEEVHQNYIAKGVGAGMS